MLGINHLGGFGGAARDNDPYAASLRFALFGRGGNGDRPATSDVGNIALTWNGSAKIGTEASIFYGSAINASSAFSAGLTDCVYTTNLENAFNVGIGDLTVDCFILRTNGSGGHYSVLVLNDSGGTARLAMAPPRYNGSAAVMQLGEAGGYLSTGHTTGTHHHYRLVRASGVVTCSMNGVPTSLGTSAYNFTGGYRLVVGDLGAYVTDLLVYAAALPTTFTPPIQGYADLYG